MRDTTTRDSSKLPSEPGAIGTGFVQLLLVLKGANHLSRDGANSLVSGYHEAYQPIKFAPGNRVSSMVCHCSLLFYDEQFVDKQCHAESNSRINREEANTSGGEGGVGFSYCPMTRC